MSYAPDSALEDEHQSSIEAVRRRVETQLMADDGVTGVAKGRTAVGDDAIVVYVRDASVIARLNLHSGNVGAPIVFEITGPIEAQ